MRSRSLRFYPPLQDDGQTKVLGCMPCTTRSVTMKGGQDYKPRFVHEYQMGIYLSRQLALGGITERGHAQQHQVHA